MIIDNKNNSNGSNVTHKKNYVDIIQNLFHVITASEVL